MLIAELAAHADVKVSTVRFYERRGMLPAPQRAPNGYREFDADDVRRVRFLRRGQELGFALRELAEFVALSDRSRDGIVLAGDLATRGAAKVREIDERIDDLRRVRSALAGLLAAQCIDPDAPCPIIAALGDPREKVIS